MKPSAPKLLLQLEGLTVVVAACLTYRAGGFEWWMFAVLFFVPDLSMIGYMLGPKHGSTAYNVMHTYLAVGVLWLLGHLSRMPHVSPLCLIWIAHIGFDRLLGYGFKYPSAFKDTHLGRV